MTLPNKKKCKYCGLEYEETEDLTFLSFSEYSQCPKCEGIQRIDNFVSEYDKKHKDSIWQNKIHSKNMIKDDYDYGKGVTAFTLAKHKTTFRIENRTKRVNDVINKIVYIREYLYLNLDPIFKILDSIYIDKDIFWNETGNFLKYVHNCCYQEAVLKLIELFTSEKCKYSIHKIKNIFTNDSKHIFNEQEIYERIEFIDSKDIMEERYQTFDIKGLVALIDYALNENKPILESMKDFRDNRFAHIDVLKNDDSAKNMSYVNLKRMFSLAKSIYDAFLYVAAPDKYAALFVEPNMWFSHLNEMSIIYKKHLEDKKR